MDKTTACLITTGAGIMYGAQCYLLPSTYLKAREPRPRGTCEHTWRPARLLFFDPPVSCAGPTQIRHSSDYRQVRFASFLFMPMIADRLPQADGVAVTDDTESMTRSTGAGILGLASMSNTSPDSNTQPALPILFPSSNLFRMRKES